MLWIFAIIVYHVLRCFDDDDDEFLRIAHKFFPSQNCALESRSDTRTSCFAALGPRMKHSYFQRKKIQLRNKRQKRLFSTFFYLDSMTWLYFLLTHLARPVRCLVFLWVVETSSSVSSSFVFEQKGKRKVEEEKVVSGERKHRLKQQQNYKSNQIPCSGFCFIFTDSDSLPTTSSSES